MGLILGTLPENRPQNNMGRKKRTLQTKCVENTETTGPSKNQGRTDLSGVKNSSRALRKNDALWREMVL